MAATHTITITVDAETHRRACVAAEQRGLSLPELVAETLSASEIMQGSEHAASIAGSEPDHGVPEDSGGNLPREERLRRFRETLARIRANNPGFSAADNLSREELYAERDFLRRRGLD